MVDTVQESCVFPVNSNGEILLQQGIGDEVVAGYIPSNQIPSNTTSNKMVVKLPSEAARVNYDSNGNAISVSDSTGLVSGIAKAKSLILTSAVAGANSGWLPCTPSAERFAFELLSGASAQLTIDGSNDGANSAAQIGTVSLDTTGVQLVSPPIWHRYPYVRITHLSGVGVVNVARAV